MRWGAVVVAGGEATLELREATGARTKALAPLAGRPSLAWLLDAVRAAGLEGCVTVGGPDVEPVVNWGSFACEGASAVDNARIGALGLPAAEALLFLPADAPLIDGDMLLGFVSAVDGRVGSAERWYAAGLSSARAFRAEFPELPMRALRLREGRLVSGALFAASPAGLRHGLDVFDYMRHHRRRLWTMLRRVGPGSMLRYSLGLATLGHAEGAIGRLLEGRALLVPDCHPATCADFDDAAEYRVLAAHLDDRRAARKSHPEAHRTR